MKREYPHSIAVFIICLVVSIPFYVSSVSADGLSNAKIYGNEGIEGYIKDGDTVTIEINAEVLGDSEITPEQVRYSGGIACDSGVPFETCEDPEMDGAYRCSINLDTTGWVLTKPKHGFEVFLFKDDCTYRDDTTVNGRFDSRGPQLTLSTDTNRASGEMNWISDIRDIDDLFGTTCSGISRVEYYLNDLGNLVDVIDINAPGPYNCSVVVGSTYNAHDFSNGDYTLYARAYDAFNNPSSVEQTYFTIDTIAPLVDDSSLTIKDGAGNDIEYLSNAQVLATVKVKIESTDDLDVSGIKADLSAFNPSRSYGNLPASCGLERNGFIECSWLIYIHISETDDYWVRLKVPDDGGNVNEVGIPWIIYHDIEGPVVNFLETDRIDSGGVSYVRRSGNTFMANIFDAGIGVGASDVILDGRALGVGKIAASDCTGGLCYWYNVTVSTTDGVKKVSISDDTKDLLGNLIDGSYEVDVTVDTTLPSFVEFNMEVGGSETPAYPDYIKTGDFLSITIDVDEIYPVMARADLSDIIDGANMVDGNCQNTEGNKWKCTWITNTINKAGNANLKFYISDFAGNLLEHTKAITVYGVTTGTADNWESSVSCSPKLLDREVATFVNQRAYCRIALTPKEGEPKTVAIGLSGCAGDQLEASSILNNQEGSTDPYVRLTFVKEEMKFDTLRVNCTLSIISLVNDKVAISPEQEVVEIGIGLYNMPLGEISEGVQNKIDDAKDIVDDWEIVGTLKAVVEYANMICTFLGIIDNIRIIWSFVTKGLTAVSWTPPGKVAETKACVVEDTVSRSEEVWYSSSNKFCKFLSCNLDFAGLDLWGLGGEDSLLRQWQAGSNSVINKIDFGASKFGISPGKYMNPRDSIVVAALTTCIPGIIYGLDKYRQIQCLYADCLESTAETGMPISICDDQKSYAECKYFYGELFNLLPITALFDYFMDLIKNALSDPLALMGVALGYACLSICPQPGGGAWHTICVLTKLMSAIGELYGDLANLGTTFETQKDYCKDGNLFGGDEEDEE